MINDLELIIKENEDQNEEVLLRAIIEKVEEMLRLEPDLLMSYLYRMDVLESKITEVLNSPAGIMPARVLGELILDRQKERILTKKKYKQDPIKGWEY